MASILDAGLASIFSSIFVFLLVYAIVWGILSWRKWMGDQPGVYAIISFVAAFLMAIAPPARDFILFVAPWYLALALVLFFILFLVSMFGLDAQKDFPAIIKNSQVYNWVIIICVLILVAGLAFTLGPALTSAGGNGQVGTPTSVGPPPGTPGSTDTGNFGLNLLNTIIHPKVLGLIITLLIASVAVYFLSNKS